MKGLLLLIALTAVDTVTGLGLGIKSMVLPAPRIPLGVTSVGDSPTANATVAAVITSAPPVATEEPVWWMEFEFMLKIFAIGSNIVLQLSPLRMITEMRLSKSTMGQSPIPLLALACCGCQWSYYGYFAYLSTSNVGFLSLIHSNVLAIVLGLYYVYTYISIASKDEANSSSIGNLYTLSLIAAILFIGEYVYCALSPEITDINNALFISGLFSASISILVAASPLVGVPAALATRSVSAIPIDMVIASAVSNVLWSIFGFLLGDPWVWIPNSVGLALSGVQIAAILYIAIDWAPWVLLLSNVLNTELGRAEKLTTIATENIKPRFFEAVTWLKDVFKSEPPSTGETY